MTQPEATASPAQAAPGLHAISPVINGRVHALHVQPWVTLLDPLREHLALPGTKMACDHGQCGACTVLLEGLRINACPTLAPGQICPDIGLVNEGGVATTAELREAMSDNLCRCGAYPQIVRTVGRFMFGADWRPDQDARDSPRNVPGLHRHEPLRQCGTLQACSRPCRPAGRHGARRAGEEGPRRGSGRHRSAQPTRAGQ